MKTRQLNRNRKKRRSDNISMDTL